VAASHLVLVCDGAHDRDPAWVFEALEAGFTVQHRAGQRARHRWLDTFDWRLLRAGLVLRQDGRPPHTTTVLERLTGEELLAVRAEQPWPSTAETLNHPDLRAQLTGPLGLRAVLPLVEVTVRGAAASLLDGEGKTVVHLNVDDAASTRPGADPLPLRIVLAAVRGYERELARAARLLTSSADAHPATTSLRQDALGDAGYDEGGYTGKVGVVLEPAAPARRSVAEVLLRVSDLLEANVPGTVADWDTEFLHDLRIAVRQIRSVLASSGDVLPAGVRDRFGPEWRWLAALTTPTRDLDVMLLGLTGRAEGFDIEGLSDLEPVLAQLSEHRRREFRRLKAGLTAPRFGALLTDWRLALDAALADATERAGGGLSTQELAASRIAKAYRRMHKRAAAVHDGSGVDDLHDLRKSGKQLRYVLDVFGSLNEPADHRRLIRDLKALQDCLGDIQDSHVHHDQLAAFVASGATQPIPVATLLSVGALVDRLQARQNRALTELMGKLAVFTGAATSARFAAMTGQGRAR
jgi:CHAD domain-containing protein